MRKFYSLIAIAAAGCMVFSASAITRQQANGARISARYQAVKTISANPFKAKADASAVTMTKVGAPMKATAFKTIDDFAGEWSVSYQGLLNGHGGAQTATWTVTVTDAAKGEVGVTMLKGLQPYKATVDLTKGTFTVANKQKLGSDDDGDIILYFKDADSSGQLVAGATSAANAVGTISGNTVTMPDMNIWALGDPASENLGWYLLGYGFSFKNNSVGGGGSGTFAKIEDFAGTYTMNMTSLLNNGANTLALTAVVSDASKNEVSFTLPIKGATIPFKATVDLQKRTFTVANKQKVGTDSDGDIILYFKEANSEGKLIAGASSAANAVGSISGNTITMPNVNIWALGDPAKEDLGWYILGYNVVLTNDDLQNGGDPNEGWSDFCTAEFTDGWLVPAFDGQIPLTTSWTVNVQQNNDDSKLFRLVKPYLASGSPVANISQAVDSKGGYINFNIATTDFVQVLPNIFSGAVNGSTKLYFTNLEGYFVSQGYTPDVIKEQLKGEITVWSTYTSADKTLTIPTCRFQTEVDGKPYVWQNQAQQSLADTMKAKLVFSKDLLAENGIDGINVDENAPEVYFNLQGIRVDNPAKGQLVIVRKGAKSYKMIAR